MKASEIVDKINEFMALYGDLNLSNPAMKQMVLSGMDSESPYDKLHSPDQKPVRRDLVIEL